MMEVEKVINILTNNVLPIFGNEENIEAISTAVDILDSVRWASCATPPENVSYVNEEDGEIIYRIIIMSSDVYGLLFVFYDKKSNTWIDAKTGYELTHQPTEEDIWVLLPIVP